MIKRDELIAFLNDYFRPYEAMAKGREMLADGVQVFGAKELTKVGLGVSVGLEFFQRAQAAGCNFLIVHHGLSFKSAVDNGNRLPFYFNERLKFLFQHGLTLAGYHALLDHHPQIGNNAWVIRQLGGEVAGNIFDQWGWYGLFSTPRKTADIIGDCEKIYTHPARVVGPAPETVRIFAVVSGSGAIDYHNPAIMNEFHENRIELEIVGDMREGHPAIAHELGLTIAAFGHYNTEKIGVTNLGKVIQEKFPSLPVEFIDVPNDL